MARLTMSNTDPGWFSVRCLFRASSNKPCGPHDLEAGENAYEERITLWQADSADHAIQLAEEYARLYETQIEVEYLGFAQAYWLADEVQHGSEVFSLIRRSELEPTEYLNRFFDTGREYQDRGD